MTTDLLKHFGPGEEFDLVGAVGALGLPQTSVASQSAAAKKVLRKLCEEGHLETVPTKPRRWRVVSPEPTSLPPLEVEDLPGDLKALGLNLSDWHRRALGTKTLASLRKLWEPDFSWLESCPLSVKHFEGEQGFLGFCQGRAVTIHVWPGLGPAVLLETLLHEVAHIPQATYRLGIQRNSYHAKPFFDCLKALAIELGAVPPSFDYPAPSTLRQKDSALTYAISDHLGLALGPRTEYFRRRDARREQTARDLGLYGKQLREGLRTPRRYTIVGVEGDGGVIMRSRRGKLYRSRHSAPALIQRFCLDPVPETRHV